MLPSPSPSPSPSSPSPSPTPIPFWKAKAEIYKKMQDDRYIVVSAHNESVGDDKKLTVASAGIIHAPEDFTHQMIMKFSEYPKYVPYIEETSYDDVTHNLFIHGAVLGYHVRMTLHTVVTQNNGAHRLAWESIGGNYVGMKGSIDEKEVDSEHTEISMNGLYVGKSLGIPAFILNWGLEFAAHRAAGAMRTHIESQWDDSKKH